MYIKLVVRGNSIRFYQSALMAELKKKVKAPGFQFETVDF